jgi:tRNA 2-selenouridine synthase
MRDRQPPPFHARILDEGVAVATLGEVRAWGRTIIDVRSPVEFAEGSLAGAINIPLFDVDERGLIGTIYRHGGREKAVDQGFAVVEKKMSALFALFAPYRHQELAVCCARGGLRSRSVVNLLNDAGFSACQLQGGYKEYRRQVLARVNSFSPQLIVIHGLTGTGKTRLLQRLDQAIDLEAFAGHRSSLFGALDQEPSSQRVFEDRLAARIDQLAEEPYFIEGESRKIGRVFIPKPLAVAMKAAVMVRIHCSLETRITRILEDYPVRGEADAMGIDTILRSMKRNMGEARVERMCTLLHQGELFELVRMLLVDYYDQRYGKSMSGYRYSLELSAEDLDQAAAELRQFRSTLLP